MRRAPRILGVQSLRPRLSWAHHRSNILILLCQRRRLLGRVRASIVNTSNAALVAADMVKHRFDNVRLYADVGHARRDRPANVVNGPTDIGLVGAKPSRIAHEKTVDNVARTRLAVTGPEALSILASKSATSRSVMASNGAGCSGAAYF